MAGKRKNAVDHAALEAAVLAHLEKRAGRRPQWSTVLDKFPGISRATLFRARDEVLKRRPDLYRPAVQNCPTTSLAPSAPPTAQSLQAPPAAPSSRMVSKRINAGLLEMWSETLGHVDGVLRCYGPQEVGGAPRNARYFLEALALRDKTVTTMIKMAAHVYNGELVQLLCESILGRLRDRDKTFASAVLGDAEAAFNDAGVVTKGLRL